MYIDTINKISEDTLREIAPAREREISEGVAFLFGDANDPQGAIPLGNGEWAFFRLVESHFTTEQVLLWWKWCEQIATGAVLELELEEFLRTEFAMVAGVSVVMIDLQPITTTVEVVDAYTGQRGQLTVHQCDWDSIDARSEFLRVRFAQELEWEICWIDT